MFLPGTWNHRGKSTKAYCLDNIGDPHGCQVCTNIRVLNIDIINKFHGCQVYTNIRILNIDIIYEVFMVAKCAPTLEF